MSTEPNKEFIRHHFGERMRRETMDEAAEDFAANALNHGRHVGREGVRRVFGALFAAFPDMRFIIHDLIAEGDTVVCQAVMEGTHLGTPPHLQPHSRRPVERHPPTERKVAVQNIHIFRVVDGKIAEHAAQRDDLGMMQQLGLIPTPPREP